eukprot:9941707-Alexandrium_andersonii.AAC.1
MSASLVGSEMCIRDRIASGDRSVNCEAPETTSKPIPEAANGVCSAPVSYTHLTLPTICSV